MLKLAEGVGVTNILHWFDLTGQKNVRDSQGPDRGWFECIALRNAVLDLARLVEAVEIGDVKIVSEIYKTENNQVVIEPAPFGQTKYVLVLAGSLASEDGFFRSLSAQSLWLLDRAALQFRVNDTPAIWLEINLRLDF